MIAHIKQGKLDKPVTHGLTVLDLDTGNVYEIRGDGNKPQLHLLAETENITTLAHWLVWVLPRLVKVGETVERIRTHLSQSLSIPQDLADTLVEAAMA